MDGEVTKQETESKDGFHPIVLEDPPDQHKTSAKCFQALLGDSPSSLQQTAAVMMHILKAAASVTTWGTSDRDCGSLKVNKPQMSTSC